MKDSLFALLLNLFEKTIAQLKEERLQDSKTPSDELTSGLLDTGKPRVVTIRVEQVKSAAAHSMRIFTAHEQAKLTKASYQFLVRMASLDVMSSDVYELILHRLMFSESRFVGLQETKWVVRNALSNDLSLEQQAFLDLVLDQQPQSSLH